MPPDENAECPRNDVLLVGDWIVDEYQFLGHHQSDMSAHTGQEHYRTLSSETEQIVELCGAGHVARSLYHLQTDRPDVKLWAVGSWKDVDEETLYHFFHSPSECPATMASFGLNQELCDRSPAEDAGKIQLLRYGPGEGVTTNRIVRRYLQRGSQLEHLSRDDRERQLTIDDEEAMWNDLEPRLPRPERVASLVVFDLGKGVITPALIERFTERYRGARLFVRSKRYRPQWLMNLDQVELAVFGPEVVAVDNPIGVWQLAGPDHGLTRKAHEILSDKAWQSIHSLLILTERQELIGRLGQNSFVIGHAVSKFDIISQVGWASALLGYLVDHAHQHGERGKFYTFKRDEFERAIEFAPSITGRRDGTDARSTRRRPEPRSIVREPREWPEEESAWAQAISSKGMGIIKHFGRPARLDVWRGSTDLPGYVCCIQEKRDLLYEIGKLLRDYRSSGQTRRSLGILLIADPGSGKTSIVNALAKRFDFALMSTNIANMMRREETLDFFDRVATRQVTEDRPVLAFVDEVNAKLESASVYGCFLTPVEKSTYERQGNRFSLKPCVWIFAGTEGQKTDDKYDDFADRMTKIVRLDFRSLRKRARGKRGPKDVTLEAKLEQLYLGATMVGQSHPGVTQVSREVLYQFWSHDPDSGPSRTIQKQVESIRGHLEGQITKENWFHPKWVACPDAGDEPITLEP